MSLLGLVDNVRKQARQKVTISGREDLGQVFTPAPTAQYMASMFTSIEGEIRLLDPGCGPCSLTAAFVDEALKRQFPIRSLYLDAFEVDPQLEGMATDHLLEIQTALNEVGIVNELNFELKDFIEHFSSQDELFSIGDSSGQFYTHVIMNPPYKKIAANGVHRRQLRVLGLDTVNLYSAFVMIAIQNISKNGELVAIIPRSFCNGAYYKPFRAYLLRECAIEKIHIFESRRNIFSDDNVLQENIIIHLIKGKCQGQVQISSGNLQDGKEVTRTVSFEEVVALNDPDQFIRITSNDFDQQNVQIFSEYFKSSLDDLGLQVSTGPVVDFRMKDDLRTDLEEGAVPLLYPVHLNHTVHWPKSSKKPNAIFVSEQSRSSLWCNEGCFVIVKRFSSKEQARRISATLYEGDLPGDLIGFENKLNVYHVKKSGFDKELALGLCVYLNSNRLDLFYRMLGGHTQINVTDLKNIKYPSLTCLRSLGQTAETPFLNQDQVDYLLDKEMDSMAEQQFDEMAVDLKISQAVEILTSLGLPRQQLNDRSALTLLALLNLPPEGSWQRLERPMLGVTPIMNWCQDSYGKIYAPNTRETFRRQTLHQFMEAGLVQYNPDDPGRAVNSPLACYQVTPELIDLLTTYGTPDWIANLTIWLNSGRTLAQKYAMERNLAMVPLVLPNGEKLKLSPGGHSELIRLIVEVFGSKFSPGAEVIYLGDTGAKEDFFQKERLAELGVVVNRKGKLPDVVLYWAERDWLLLIESVTSHGPVDSKRHGELAELFKTARPGLVYVSAFPNRKVLSKYMADLSWETEVWVAEDPEHMIHLNGDRFLGPH